MHDRCLSESMFYGKISALIKLSTKRCICLIHAKDTLIFRLTIVLAAMSVFLMITKSKTLQLMALIHILAETDTILIIMYV